MQISSSTVVQQCQNTEIIFHRYSCELNTKSREPRSRENMKQRQHSMIDSQTGEIKSYLKINQTQRIKVKHKTHDSIHNKKGEKEKTTGILWRGTRDLK